MEEDRIRNRLNKSNSAERIDPERDASFVIAIHQTRYRFASRFCRDKVVVDAACGVGYGSFELGSVSTRVIGIDIDDHAVQYAKSRYERENVAFEVRDVAATGLGDGSADVFCSFETIEHLEDSHTFLKEVTRVLRQDGLLIVSTPVVRKTQTKPHESYHFIEYDERDFRQLLSSYFNQVSIYGQRRKQTAAHALVTRFMDVFGLRGKIPSFLNCFRKNADCLMKTTPFDEMTDTDIYFQEGKTAGALSQVAICREPKSAFGKAGT